MCTQVYKMKNRILHITPHLGGGVGRVLLNYFSKVKDDPSFVHKVACLDYANHDAIEVARNVGFSLLDNMSEKKQELLDIIADSDIVLIHWWNHPLLYDFLVREQLSPCRVIMWSHNSGFHPPGVFTVKVLVYPDLFIFTTPMSYKTKEILNLTDEQKKSLRVVWSTGGVDHVKSVKSKIHTGFNVGYIGTVDYCKMHPDFLNICNQVDIPNVNFIVCGGPKEKELKQEAKRLGIGGKFDFTGRVLDIKEYLSIFDIFGYPLAWHHYGTCDQTLQESMAAGVVPVVLANQMESYMVKDKVTGIVAKDKEEYIKALQDLYHNRELRNKLSQNAKEYAIHTFSLEKMANKWNKLFDEVLDFPKTVREWKNSKKGEDISPKDVFLESLGHHGEDFVSYCNAKSDEEKKSAIEKIKKLAESANWQAETRGTVHHYNSFFPNEPYLSVWSQLMRESKSTVENWAMKKILFIIPPSSSFEDFNPKNPISKMPVSTAPYGILSLITYINKDKKKYDAQIIDCNQIILDILQNSDDNYDFKGIIIENIKSSIANFKPHYVGISVLFNSNFSHLKYIAPAIKEFYPECVLIVGGGLATNMYSTLLEEIPCIDALCHGEGEIPLKKLLESENEEDITSLSSAWITKKTIKNNLIPQGEFINDLDDIPIIDFNYIDIKKYNNRSPALIDTFDDKKSSISKIELSIHTSRGCPFNCVFCSNGKIHGKKIRYMSTKRVKETIKHYIDNYNMNVLLIEDDNFLSKKDRALEILKTIKDFNIKVEFPNGVAVYGINDDIVQAFDEAGVEVVPLAIESGSDYVLQKIIQKPLKIEQIPKAVNSLKKFKIRVHAFIVIGFPNEFDEHRKETFDMLLNLGIDWAYIFIAIPIAGSRLYEICEKQGYLLNKDYDNYHMAKCNIKAPGVDPEKIEKEAYYMNIVINFIANSNYKSGNHNICLPYFLHVVKKYPNHAIAHYMLSEIYLKTKQKALSNKHRNIYKTIISQDPFWALIYQRLQKDQLIN